MQVLTADDIDFAHYMTETDAAEKVRPARDFLNDVMHALAPAFDTPICPKIPFQNAWLYFQPGEVTVWAGFNNSGKSAIQGQVLAGFAEQGIPCCIASFEMKPAKTIARIVKQSTNHAAPTRDQVEFFLKRVGDNLWLYDQQGTVKSDRIVAVIRHCAEVLKVKHLAIDSLMKCIRGTDDYSGQKDFVDMLTACARDYKIHIHLVAHLKKGDTDERMPTRYDISGAADISNLVDNVLMVWRNKRKERDSDQGKQVNEDDPDTVLIIDKQRNGEWEGRVKLWYDKTTLKFTDFNKNLRRGLAQVL